jgi:hypothetical protein
MDLVVQDNQDDEWTNDVEKQVHPQNVNSENINLFVMIFTNQGNTTRSPNVGIESSFYPLVKIKLVR